MKKSKMVEKVQHPDRVLSYFKLEIAPLTLITVSGIIYNIGMTAGPYFEGQLAQRLFDIMNGEKTFSDMVRLAAVYLAVILVVQGMRCIKRFYVRRFANDTSRNMRHMLYNSLVHKSKREFEEESTGSVMTKAVSDVDTCVEGMRKFTTEIFDTGVVLVSYLVMLFVYDVRLAVISCLFTPAAYIVAARLKTVVTKYNAAYKKSAGKLNDATLDRIGHAVTYRVNGVEEKRNEAYDERLADYEKCAVKANVWENTLQPLYNIVSMIGVIFIIYFGAKNVMGTGWTSWNIAAFTTFLSCFAKMALKSSKAAKLFNAVQKAEVSWKRIKPLMKEYVNTEDIERVQKSETAQKSDETQETETGQKSENPQRPEEVGKKALSVKNLSFEYPDGEKLFENLCFHANPGEIIGVTGPVAAGKSAFGKVFLCEYPYEGSIRFDGIELSEFGEVRRSSLISYLGHEPELMSTSVAENISLGEEKAVQPYLDMVSMEQEVEDMPEGDDTPVGNGGICLSGGQQDRLALARTLYHGKKLIVLDDPFSAVDKKTEREIYEKLRTDEKDKIIILISHRLGLFPEFDQVLWINRKEHQVGNHEELMKTNEKYKELYELQTAGGDFDDAE